MSKAWKISVSVLLAGSQLAYVAGCGGKTFVGSPDQTNHDAGEGGVADGGSKDGAGDAKSDVSDAMAETIVDAPQETVPLDATEEPIVPEAGLDAVAETPPVLGACGIIPVDGWWICYVLPHVSGLSGLAGAVASSQDVSQDWKDPMQGIFGPCVASDPASNAVECALGKPPAGSFVSFAPGLHPAVDAPTLAGTFACNAENCVGISEIYMDGALVGSYDGFSTQGLLFLFPHYDAVRKDLAFQIQ